MPIPAPLRVLVVGSGMYVCGRGTDSNGTVLPSLAEASRRGLVGAVAVSVRKRSSFAALLAKLKGLNRLLGTRLAVESFVGPGSHRAAAREFRPDAALIVTPDDTHAAIASDLIRAGVHVLVVKPLAPSLAEARALERLARERGVHGAVEFHKRFDEANLKLVEALRSGRLGDVSYFVVEYSQRRSVPLGLFRDWAARTNIFQYLGVHYADIIRFATGARPLRAAALGRMGLLAAKGVRTYDSVQALIEWEASAPKRGRFSSAILVNWIDPDSTTALSDQRIKVIGTLGRFESDQKDRGVSIVSEGRLPETINPYFSQFFPAPGGRGLIFAGYGEKSFRSFLEDASELKAGRTTPAALERVRPSFREALASTAVVDGVNRSLARNGAWVRL